MTPDDGSLLTNLDVATWGELQRLLYRTATVTSLYIVMGFALWWFRDAYTLPVVDAAPVWWAPIIAALVINAITAAASWDAKRRPLDPDDD